MYISGEKDVHMLRNYCCALVGNSVGRIYSARGQTCIDCDIDQEDQAEIEKWDDPAVDINMPSDLSIRVNVGTLLVNDDTAITADPEEIKYVLVTVLMDDTTQDLEVECTTQLGEHFFEDDYEVSEGKTLVGHVGYYKVAASGTEIEEV